MQYNSEQIIEDKFIIGNFIKDDIVSNIPELSDSIVISKSKEDVIISSYWFLLVYTYNDLWTLSFRTNTSIPLLVVLMKSINNYIAPDDLVYYNDFYMHPETKEIYFGEDAHIEERIYVNKKKGNYICYNCQLYFQESHMNDSKTLCKRCDSDSSITFH